jgi:hypothetical protein
MMDDGRHSRALRQKVVEVPFPSGWVVTRAVLHDASPIEDAFDPASDAGCSLVLVLPDRLQNLQNQRIVDRRNRLFLEDRINVCLKRGCPLLGVLAVLPAVLVGGDVGLGTLLERDGLSRFGALACCSLRRSSNGSSPLMRMARQTSAFSRASASDTV